MTQSQITLRIEPRSVDGTTEARAVRRAGLVPGILYGKDRDPLAFQVDVPTLRTALSGDGGRHAILTLEIVGEKATTPAVLKDYQVDPVRDRISHVDLLAIRLDEKIVTSVTVQIVGEAPGVVEDGGVLEQPAHEIEVEALPGDLPDAITVDVSALGAGGTIKLGELAPPPGVEWRSDADTVLATVLQPTTMEQIEAEQAAEAGLEPTEDEADEPDAPADE